MATLFKTVCLAAGFLAVTIGQDARAATFEARRGLNLDTWVTWPEEPSWSDPETLSPFPEWRGTVGAEGLAGLKAAGFDHLRIPVDPAPFLSSATLPYRDRLYRGVLEAARAVNAAGLKAIVDLHLFPRHDNPDIGMAGVMEDPARFDAYLEIVRRMGRTLALEDPRKVALELMNEPHGACEPGEGDWPHRLRRLHAAARSSALDLTLILSGACGGSAEGLAGLDPTSIPDDNVIWTFHSYQPFVLTHQGAMWAGDFVRHVTGLTYPPHAMDPARRSQVIDAIRRRIRDDAPWTRRHGMLSYLDEQLGEIDTPEKLQAALERPFRIVAAWADRHGIAPESIYLGEFGMIRQEWENPSVVPASSRAAYVADMIAIAERRGYGWATWSYGGAFGVVEEFEGRRAEPDVLDVVRALN
ncbi:MAG: glycoside hydrolase family 5 protein [Rhizobiaceae bacterium]|nr:glycoside hydrolase family 5 protein [Rhizobiaceae bacterium]MCV0408748.1 glycoside hydrolase family 5 protein [Rhizobiaceae bacterium]